jgi:hypothetical protein
MARKGSKKGGSSAARSAAAKKGWETRRKGGSKAKPAATKRTVASKPRATPASKPTARRGMPKTTSARGRALTNQRRASDMVRAGRGGRGPSAKAARSVLTAQRARAFYDKTGGGKKRSAVKAKSAAKIGKQIRAQGRAKATAARAKVAGRPRSRPATSPAQQRADGLRARAAQLRQQGNALMSGGRRDRAVANVPLSSRARRNETNAGFRGLEMTRRADRLESRARGVEVRAQESAAKAAREAAKPPKRTRTPESLRMSRAKQVEKRRSISVNPAGWRADASGRMAANASRTQQRALAFYKQKGKGSAKPKAGAKPAAQRPAAVAKPRSRVLPVGQRRQTVMRSPVGQARLRMNEARAFGYFMRRAQIPSTSTNWGSQRGQGKRLGGGMVRGAMSAGLKGTRNYLDYSMARGLSPTARREIRIMPDEHKKVVIGAMQKGWKSNRALRLAYRML